MSRRRAHRRYRRISDGRAAPDDTSSYYSSAEVVAARNKSYVGPAILVLVLYFVMWLPGLIANYLYLEEAKRRETIAD
jgi:hypothetical protein